ncbi:hypothetical protein T4B_5650 [Trichinella pseudospiralis]|uniref:Uncharacterized protein n=1 Tax=Trichinella pseudospiralis TaxID=6337 RepID=A0A0V1GZV4_TRIPS|nr:hypothetical protein T4B_5650 [Trichinella pseudospiralis]
MHNAKTNQEFFTLLMLTFNGMLSESDKVERLALCDHGDHGYDRHSGADPFRTRTCASLLSRTVAYGGHVSWCGCIGFGGGCLSCVYGILPVSVLISDEGKFTQFAVRFRFLTIYHGDRALANEVAVRRVKRCVMVDALLPLLA